LALVYRICGRKFIAIVIHEMVFDGRYFEEIRSKGLTINNLLISKSPIPSRVFQNQMVLVKSIPQSTQVFPELNLLSFCYDPKKCSRCYRIEIVLQLVWTQINFS
jgi:hypothetical protein